MIGRNYGGTEKSMISGTTKKNDFLEVKKMIKKRKVNWVLTLVLSVLLGGLGVDRFVMGKIGTGILKLLVTVLTLGMLGWIWWIIDIILIATKHNFEGVEWVEN